ncbi:MAG: hypothetical protein F4Z38_04895 [Chloroflexi bacterium]|nr:hypothetical protein [Chloroflexota bacterium]
MLDLAIAGIDQVRHQINGDLSADVSLLTAELRDFRDTFAALARALEGPDWSTAASLASSDSESHLTVGHARRIGREISRMRHPASIPVQAGLGWHIESSRLLRELQQAATTRMVAITGSAGFGKTHLAAELTAPKDSMRPSGIYLAAWRLSRRGNLADTLTNDAASQFKSFQELLEGIDAAGIRAGVRIPVFIDGLNESEDPLIWSDLLASLQVHLQRYRHVLVVVTLRDQQDDEEAIVLPEDCIHIHLEGFARLTDTAVQKYFGFYKIKPGYVRLPLDRFANPLFLRIFCEATNARREHEVYPERIPASFHAVFDSFRDAAIGRLVSQPGGHRWSADSIRDALDKIALALWNDNSRSMEFGKIQKLIGEEAVEWTLSLARALRDEGILGVERGLGRKGRTVFLYDSFAGFMVASALLAQVDRRDFSTWITAELTSGQLQADSRNAHPLADDIRKAIVAFAPRHFGTQLWKHAEGAARTEALIEAAHLEVPYLDQETIEAIAQTAMDVQSGTGAGSAYRLYDRFREIRDVPNHPLNADFLDSLLVRLPVAGRDLTWTEWVRSREATIVSDLLGVEEEWQERAQRTPRDRLDALWIKWLLTSTLRELRDLATRALYWFGRGDPRALFELVESSVHVNDPYVIERLLAAAYGVLMAAPGERRDFGDELNALLGVLWEAYCSDASKCPTEHWLIREYVDGIVGVVTRYYPSALGKWRDNSNFATPSRPTPIGRDDARQTSENLVHGIDFENYTVGRLVPDRGNYDYGHPEFEEVLSWIRARVWQLGWHHEQFRTLEEEMSRYRAARERRSGRLESYRKKYGWIGFYEAAGRLVSEGRPPFTDEQNRLSDMDIDPSFPVMPPQAEFSLPNWLGESTADLRTWVTKGTVEIPDYLLRSQALAGHEGPWLATSGYLEQQDLDAQRAVPAIARAFLVPRRKLPLLRKILKESTDPAWLCPVTPESTDIFVGETPWRLPARADSGSGNVNDLYSRSVRTPDGGKLHLELIDHHYRWVGNPLSTDAASEHLMPAVTLADSLDLREVPNSLDWCDGNGKRASIVLSAPAECRDGHIVYVREDLIRQYCDERNYSLIWIVYGERMTWSSGAAGEGLEWLVQAHDNNEHMWSCVKSLEELTGH